MKNKNNDNDEVLESIPLKSLPPLLPDSLYLEENDQITPPPGFPPLHQIKKQRAQRSPPPINQTPINATPINAIPMSSAFQVSKKPTQPKKSDSRPVNKKAKPIARSLNRDLLSLASSNLSNESKEHTEAVLSTFDALRRRLVQIADVVDKRADMKAGAIMNVNDLKANRVKRVGTVPGIEVGDIFYFRMEMCVLGLHSPVMAGIDYIKDSEHGSQKGPIVVSIVSSGGYENEEDNVYELVYTGEGGNGRNEDKRHDQKLVKGNLAMEMSLQRGNEIRVIRSVKDPFCMSNKIYVYDGLYKIHHSWVDVSKKGFRVFKYKLVRQPGQPDGIGIWYKIQKWILNPVSRENVILQDLSFGEESIPVIVVNEMGNNEGKIDDVTNFKYETTMKCKNSTGSKKALEGCRCHNVCIPDDEDNCTCVKLNGGDLPYTISSILVKRINMVHECGTNCMCSLDCRNRVTRKGIKFHFEIFKTLNKGWGVRSWDPIRAGSFICEFVGEIVNNSKLDKEGFNMNEYLFCATSIGQKALKWNRGAELATDEDYWYDKTSSVPIPVINAKEMGNLSRFMNHSCDPNVFWQLVKFGDEEVPHVMFFAIKHIPPLTELTYDYGGGTMEGSSDTGSRAKVCFCGASNCRGRFG